jgi:hypothetical protein
MATRSGVYTPRIPGPVKSVNTVRCSVHLDRDIHSSERLLLAELRPGRTDQVEPYTDRLGPAPLLAAAVRFQHQIRQSCLLSFTHEIALSGYLASWIRPHPWRR